MQNKPEELLNLAFHLKDDLEPILSERLAKKIADLVLNYGYTRTPSTNQQGLVALDEEELKKFLMELLPKRCEDFCGIYAEAIFKKLGAPARVSKGKIQEAVAKEMFYSSFMDLKSSDKRDVERIAQAVTDLIYGGK